MGLARPTRPSPPAPAGAVVGGATYTLAATGGASRNSAVFHHRRLGSSVVLLSHWGVGPSFYTPAAALHPRQPRPGTPNYNAAPQALPAGARQGQPDRELHLHGTGLGHRRCATLPPDRHRHLGPDPGHHRRCLSSTGVCSITAGLVSFTGSGTCTIDANHKYGEHQLQRRLVCPAVDQRVERAPSTITFTSTRRLGHRRWGHLPPGRHPDRRSSTAADCTITGGAGSFTGNWATAPSTPTWLVPFFVRCRPSWWKGCPDTITFTLHGTPPASP